ncbi:MAG: radical SAM protein, partial [Candidatus Omnitrophica bacterium]|nr:radical SAM protein [Candidatus Omnitrophota bacterium]
CCGRWIMKVALINPAARGAKYSVEPLGLGYIAGYLEQNGIDVMIIDQVAGDNINRQVDVYKPDIVGIACRPDIIGISSMTPLVIDAYRIADTCRRKGILTVMGGPHPSAMPEEALEHADVVVVGEGEKAMLDIVKDGISSGIVSRPYVENIDELPLPARHLMKQEFYLHTASKLKMFTLAFLGSSLPSVKSASILTSRGCPFHCIFCHNSLRQSPVRFHGVARVLDEIRQLKTGYGVEAMTFLDDNFLANKPRAEEICRKITAEKLDVLWSCVTSAQFIDRRTATMIKDAGCRQVNFGCESGSQRILDVLEKSATVEQNREAIRICKEAGILVAASFMIGNPTETVEDVRLTQRFIFETQPEEFYVNITTPYPGTKLWESCNKKLRKPLKWGDFYRGSLQVYPFSPFDKAELGKLFLETILVKPVASSSDWKSALRYPGESVGWFLRHPLTAVKIILGRYVMKNKKSNTRNADVMENRARGFSAGGGA